MCSAPPYALTPRAEHTVRSCAHAPVHHHREVLCWQLLVSCFQVGLWLKTIPPHLFSCFLLRNDSLLLGSSTSSSWENVPFCVLNGCWQSVWGEITSGLWFRVQICPWTLLAGTRRCQTDSLWLCRCNRLCIFTVLLRPRIFVLWWFD